MYNLHRVKQTYVCACTCIGITFIKIRSRIENWLLRYASAKSIAWKTLLTLPSWLKGSKWLSISDNVILPQNNWPTNSFAPEGKKKYLVYCFMNCVHELYHNAFEELLQNVRNRSVCNWQFNAQDWLHYISSKQYYGLRN